MTRRSASTVAKRFSRIIVIVLVLGFGLSFPIVRKVAASPPDVGQMLRYYEGTWSVEVHPAAGNTTSLRPYSVTITCSDVGSGRDCRSHFTNSEQCCGPRDFLARYVKSKQDAAIVYEENLQKYASSEGRATSPVIHRLTQQGQVAEGEDYMQKGSFCGRGDTVEEEMHVYRRDVSTIDGPDEYKLERFSKWVAQPACPESKDPAWELEMTAVFRRQK
jgi:hypothetical protein